MQQNDIAGPKQMSITCVGLVQDKQQEILLFQTGPFIAVWYNTVHVAKLNGRMDNRKISKKW